MACDASLQSGRSSESMPCGENGRKLMKGMLKNLHWSMKMSGEVFILFIRLRSKGFLASSLSIYDLSTVFTPLPHNKLNNYQN